MFDKNCMTKKQTRSAEKGVLKGKLSVQEGLQDQVDAHHDGKMSANMYSGGKVHPVNGLSAVLADHDRSGDELGKIVHSESGKSFLKDVLHFFRMEGRKANGVFELTKRRLNAPLT